MKSTAIPMSTEANVEVDRLRLGMLTSEPAAKLCTSRKTVMVRRLAEVKAEVPVTVLVDNFNGTPVRLEVGRKIRYSIRALFVNALE